MIIIDVCCGQKLIYKQKMDSEEMLAVCDMCLREYTYLPEPPKPLGINAQETVKGNDKVGG